LPLYVPEQVPEKTHAVRAANPMIEHLLEEPSIGRDAADHRQVLMQIGHAQHRRPALRCPRAYPGREQREARLIDAHERAPFVTGLFFEGRATARPAISQGPFRCAAPPVRGASAARTRADAGSCRPARRYSARQTDEA